MESNPPDGENAAISTNETAENAHTVIQYALERCDIHEDLKKDTDVVPPPPPKKEEDTSKILLEPDHPLLASFQRTLKEQLERQLNQLKEDVQSLDIGIKNKSVERTTLGNRIYDAQQMITFQQENIDQMHTDMEKWIAERSEIESNLVEIQETYNENKNKLTLAEQKDNEIRNELETLGFLLHKMNEWQEKLQSDIAVNQRITDKSKIDNKNYMEEMRNLDFIIYKLMTEVFRLENSLEHLSMQLRIKEQERGVLGTKISEANMDIEALEQEQKRLMHSWNCVLVAIGHRDKIYFAAQKDLEKEQEVVKATITEIAGFKRLSQQAMEKNEQLTLFKERNMFDKSNLAAKFQYEQERLMNLERKLMERQAMVMQVAKDLERVQMERRMKEQELGDIRMKTTKQSTQKAEIEERILFVLQEQITSDKISKYMNKTIRDLREKNRNYEIQLALIENKNADILVAVEQQKNMNDECSRHLAEAIKKEKLKEKEITDKKNELASYVLECNKNLCQYDIASKKYDELVVMRGGIELTPLEMKIKTLEKRIAELEEKNSKLKSLWLREQLYIVGLQKERSTQIYEMNLMRKQTLLLQQRNLKLEDELEELAYLERKHERTMNNMKSRIDKLNCDLWKKRDRKDAMDLNNLTLKIDFVNKLKDAEMDCIKLEAKITDMEEEKDTLSRNIIEANREMLAWEQKVKLAQETKLTLSKEKSSEGELGTMKSEIQRMTVRYSQLKKAQEKLVQDLNHCISRREFIYVNATATEKRLSGAGKSKTDNRVKFAKKLENMRGKIAKMVKEKNYYEEKIDNAKKLEMQFYENINESKEIEQEMQNKIQQLMDNIENEKFDRNKELEILVYKQHKLRAFTSMSRKQYRQKFRLKTVVEKEYSHQSGMNSVLQTIVENLIADFPNRKREFLKALNTLKVVHDN